MLNQGSNVSRGNATLSPDMPPLPQCLPLEPITLGNQKYTRSGELRRVLGVPLGSATATATEDHSFGVAHPKPPPPVASEELKHFKESVQDASRKARDRAKLLRESIFKLEKYREVLTSKKRQRSDLLLNERSSGTNVVKAGIQNHRNPHDAVAQRVGDKTKSAGMNKRVRTSMADVRGDGRNPIASRQQAVTEKGGDMLQDVGSGNGRFEEKIRKLPAVGEGWETKNKKKRSVGVVAGRVMTSERDVKRAVNPKMSADAKLRSSDAQAFRSKSSAGVGGINKLDGPLEPTASDASAVRSEMESGSIPRDRMAPSEQRVLTKSSNKPNVHDDNLANSPSTMIKAKVSRAPRTGSIMLLDSSLKVHSSSVPPQGLEQASNSNRVSMVGNDHKGQTSAGSSSHGMAKWVGQRSHKNSRSRRANIAAPVANHAEVHTSSQGFPPSDFNARVAQANGSIMASSIENNIPKFKRETEGVPSPFEFSESEESGAGDTKPKDKGTDSGEVSLNVTEKVGAFHFPSKKSKLPVNDIGDGVRRQGRSGRGPSAARLGAHPVRQKLESLPTGKPIQSLKPASDKSKSKTGRPPSKKLKDRKALARVGPALSGGSVDFTGESDDDREELFAAANAARNAKNIASSGPFWKKMESIFASVSPDDLSYLKQQLSFAQELDESLSQMLGSAYDVLGVIVDRGPDYSRKRQGVDSNQVKKASLGGTLNMGSLEKSASLYQRVLSALIEEDESEEFHSQSEGKNMSLHYASDDSHCGSCNLIELETRDRDRMESEVESKVDSQSQKNFFMDRLPCDRTVASNANRNASFSSSLQSSEHWPGDDDFSHSDVGLASETCSSDVGLLHSRELSMPVLSSSDDQYQLMCLDDRLILELQSIGLCPEILPDLADEEVFNQEMMELRKGLYQQNGVKKKKLDKIDAAIQKGGDAERRIAEQVALDQLIEMAYRKRLACRGNHTSKNAVRKVSRQVALGFVKRAIARCRKFEETGASCFSEPALEEVIFSMPSCNNDTKSVDCVGSGTASNTCNEISNHRAEARASGVTSSSFERYGSPSDNFDRGKKREVLIDDVIGSASSRVTSTLDSTVIGGVKGTRSDRERDQNKDNLRSTSVSGASRAPVDGNKNERRTKSKPKQKNTHLSSSANGPRGAPNASNKVDRADAAKEVEEPLDFSQLQLPDFDAIGLGESNDLTGPQDLSNWLNFDEEGLQDHDSAGLEIPMDDLMDLQMLM